MRFYARFACGYPHFRTSWYKISYDTRAKKRFLDKCDYITRLRLVLQTHTRQKTFHRTRSVIYYFSFQDGIRYLSEIWCAVWYIVLFTYLIKKSRKFIIIAIKWYRYRCQLLERHSTFRFLQAKMVRCEVLAWKTSRMHKDRFYRTTNLFQSSLSYIINEIIINNISSFHVFMTAL